MKQKKGRKRQIAPSWTRARPLRRTVPPPRVVGQGYGEGSECEPRAVHDPCRTSALSDTGGRISVMPPRRRTPIPTPIDVDAVRRKLAEGKIVRVGISRSAQFPDGGIGRVRRVGDPTVDGEEYVQVELTLNGTKDTLPFTPADLTPATRATTPAAAPEAGPRSTRGRTPKAAPAPGLREPP